MSKVQGTWWIHSKIDPRWNGTGQGECEMFYPVEFDCPEAVAWIEECKEKFGEKPEDLGGKFHT